MDKKTTRQGAGGRGKKYQYAIRVYTSGEDRAEIERKARLAGLSASSYLLMAGLERPDRKGG